MDWCIDPNCAKGAREELAIGFGWYCCCGDCLVPGDGMAWDGGAGRD